MNFNLTLPRMEDIHLLDIFFDKNYSEKIETKPKEEINIILDDITINSRNYIINGKLELFMIYFDKGPFLNYLNEFCDVRNLDKILSSSNFSLTLCEKRSKKV